nr:MAG TPA: hypothetical protein [Caudoviricetes sp.]
MHKKIKRFWKCLTRKRFESDDERLETAQTLICFSIAMSILSLTIIVARLAKWV